MNYINIAEQSQQPLNYNKYSIHVKPVFKLLKSQRRKSQTPIASQSRAVFQHLTVTPVSSSMLWHFFDPGNILHDPSVHSSNRTIISAKTWLTDHSGEEYESGFFYTVCWQRQRMHHFTPTVLHEFKCQKLAGRSCRSSFDKAKIKELDPLFHSINEPCVLTNVRKGGLL